MSPAEIAQTLELVRQGRMRPVVTRVYALKDIEQAHEAIRRNATLGRVAMAMSR